MTRRRLGRAGVGWLLVGLSAGLDAPPAATPIGFLATGNQTYIMDASGRVAWTYPHASRDGWVLPDGHVLLALNRDDANPGGSVAEVDRDGQVVFAFKGTQSEVNTVQPLPGGRVLLTEAGDRPRLLEVDRQGRVLVDVPLQAQTKDHHLQTRMARKLENGNYLVPQLLDKVVREYTPGGRVVWEAATPDMPFTAIRLPDGNTLVGCTVGNLVVELDPAGRVAWKLTNDDLPGRPISDACGVQRLADGDTLVASYRASGDAAKLLRVTRAKRVAWTHRDPRRPGVHHFQVLGDDLRPPAGPQFR